MAAATRVEAQECSTHCGRYEQGQCVEYVQTCSTPGAPARGAAPSYGAIAYGRSSQAWGYSYRWSSRARAESEALKNCQDHGDDCEIMVWFEHKCGAVAAGDSDAFWGLGGSEKLAEADAQGKCAAAGSNKCDVQVSRCSR
ncbi:MAG: DUF4189 domain-containing protein [Alphaproteobacteria bacterium]|nr:DUF4189 domain-containing protein [Alphaproteobacteria bacterium]